MCGTLINLIFYWVELSGSLFLSGLANKFGVFGPFLIEMINFLPYLGAALGIVMIRTMFQDQWEREKKD